MGNKLPAGVWSMGFVSLLMGFSSEMIHSLLPLFRVGTLGASVALAGLIEGLAEALALVSRVFSGVISDRPAGAKAWPCSCSRSRSACRWPGRRWRWS
jgi:nitrate/nitrite transporter NarK